MNGTPAKKAGKIGLLEKLGFGAFSLSMDAFNNFLSTFLLFFLTDVLGITPGLAGTASMIGTVWDGVNDPLIGFFSTNHRFKSREVARPYALWFAIPTAIFFVLIFRTTGLPQHWVFPYFLLIYLIFDTFREEILFQRSIPMDLITESFALCRAHHVHIQAYTGSKVVSESDNHHIRKYLSIQKLGFLLVDDIRTSGIGSSPKLLCLDYDDPERLTAFRHVFESEMSEKLDCFNSNPNLLEIVPKGVNKGAALRMVADHYGVPVENTISAGDAENDLPMIIAAGIGCAMMNGSESLKQAADYVTTRDNNHGGVAEILNRFCF